MTRDSYVMVPIDSLAPSGYNPNVLSAEDFAALINELRAQGSLQKPIVARNGPAIPHEIIDGEHNWRAAKEVGFTEVPVQREDADDFEARRQTLIRNRTGKKDNLKLGCVYRDMLAERSLSNRDLAEELSISEGSVRNQLLYPECWDLLRLKGERGMTESGAPIEPECYLWHAGLYVEQTISKYPVRALRALMSRLQGLDEEETDSDQPAADQPADEERHLRLVKLHWPKITGDGQQKFYEWSGIAQKLAELFDQQQVLVREAHAKGYAEGFEQGRAQRVTVTQSEPGRPRKQQQANGPVAPPEPVRDSHATDQRVWLTYAGKGTLAARVLEYVAAQPDVAHTSDIMKACGCNPGEAQRVLTKKLKPAGYIRKVRYGQWAITDYGRAALSSQLSEPECVTATQPTPEPSPQSNRGDFIKAQGTRIQAARVERGLSQKQAGEAAGVHQSVVSMVERGELTPSGGPKAGAAAFVKLAAALGLTA